MFRSVEDVDRWFHCAVASLAHRGIQPCSPFGIRDQLRVSAFVLTGAKKLAQIFGENGNSLIVGLLLR